MKIDNTSYNLPLINNGEAKARQSSGKAVENTTSPTVSGTTVNLGATSNYLPLNASKIADIKQAISEGRFQINANVVSDTLIKSVNDLISANP